MIKTLRQLNAAQQIAQSPPPPSGLMILICLCLLTFHVLLINQNIRTLSPVGPEIGHLVRGAEAIVNRKSELAQQVHPYDYLVGLQLLDSPNNHRPTVLHPDQSPGKQLDQLVNQWLDTGIFNTSDSPLINARRTTLLMSVLLGLVVLISSRRLWGNQGALLSLALYCFSPSVIAHASLATPDLANALILLVLGTWTWQMRYKVSRTQTPPRIWPVMLLLLLGCLQWAMAKKPLPTDMWIGSWYLNGKTFTEHPANFYLYSFLIKTPLVIWAVWGLALAAWLKRKGKRLDDLQRAWPMLCILLSTMYVAARITEPIGHRLLLPLYPVLFILAGAPAPGTPDPGTPDPGTPDPGTSDPGSSDPSHPGSHPAVHGRTKSPAENPSANVVWQINRSAWLCVLAVFVLAIQAFYITPDFLTFTNQAAGPRDRAYQHLAVDNLDWGQAHQRAAIHADYLASFGPQAEADPATKPISLLQWNNKPLRGGVYVISSNYITGATPAVLPKEWTPKLEAQYQRLRDLLNAGYLKKPLAQAGSHHDKISKPLSYEQWMWLRLRLARLCAHLRIREPDSVISHSMLSYQLSDEQVQFILDTVPYPQSDDARTMDW